MAKELEALAEPVPDATYEDQDQLLQAEQERTEALLARSRRGKPRRHRRCDAYGSKWSGC
ncbi:hypothetical protein E1B22_12195 [Thermaerobacter sp. FW80]|nr:hypothetical protein E1B22_12195 [Thermaerobacter sp. FW80]